MAENRQKYQKVKKVKFLNVLISIYYLCKYVRRIKWHGIKCVWTFISNVQWYSDDDFLPIVVGICGLKFPGVFRLKYLGVTMGPLLDPTSNVL